MCPLCRAPLPPGREKLYELANRVWLKIMRAVGSNGAWPPLSPSQQKEMNGAIVMLQEAMDQVRGRGLLLFLSALTRLYGTLHAGPHRGCWDHR